MSRHTLEMAVRGGLEVRVALNANNGERCIAASLHEGDRWLCTYYATTVDEGLDQLERHIGIRYAELTKKEPS